MKQTSTSAVEKVRKQDILTGKNYLKEDELQALKLIVEQYLAYAESQALAHRPMYMRDWKERLDGKDYVTKGRFFRYGAKGSDT